MTARGEFAPSARDGKDRGRDAAGRASFAQTAEDRKEFAAAARFWAEAFAADPKLAADRKAQRLDHAAHAAILAADGRGKDEPPPDDRAKARLRAQAADWLKADLAAWAKLLQPGSNQDRAALRQATLRWKTDPDLASIRDSEALKKLPEDEQKPWRTLWAAVETLLNPDDPWNHTHFGEARRGGQARGVRCRVPQGRPNGAFPRPDVLRHGPGHAGSQPR